MRLARGCAGWALTAAGTLGLTVAAVAQTPRQLPSLLPQTPVAVETQVAADGCLARLMEIRVELAWLADPDTFPYELAAHGTGATLEVGGMVPSETVRAHALRVAQAHCPHQVVDRLLVMPGAGNPPVRKGDVDLCRAAGENLSRMLAGRDEPFQVAADPNGQISILGTVPSCEDKLRISRRMSQLPGCTAVVNSLVVARVMKDGQVCTPLTSDGYLLVAGDPLDLLPPPAVNMPTTPVVVQASGSSTPGIPAALIPAGMEVPALPGGVAVVNMEPMPGQPVPMPVVDNRLQAMPVCKPCVACQPAKPVAARKLAKQSTPCKSCAGGRRPQPTSPYASLGVGQYIANGPAGSPYAAVYTKPLPATQPSPLPTALAAAPALAQPAQAAPAGTIQQASAVQTGNKTGVQQASATAPAKPTTPLPAANAQPAATDKNTAPAKLVDKDAKPLTPNQVHIKRLIEVACGDLARDIELKPMGGNRLVVSLRVRSAGEGQRLGERILAMPELEPYKVEIEMEVKP